MVVAGLLLALAVYTVLRDQDVSYRVAVAAADLRPGTAIAAGSFQWIELKMAEEVAGRLLQADMLGEFDGWVAATTIPAGDLISRADLRPPSAPSELRAMSLPIEPERAVGGELAPGDRVDVIAVIDEAPAYVATDLEVLAVASPGRDGTLAPNRQFSVTVAVDDQTALALAQALETEKVSILRSTGSTRAQPTTTSLAPTGQGERAAVG